MHEYVFRLPTNEYVYLTVVADEAGVSAFGIDKGWYVAEKLPEKDAKWLIDALEPFTALCR